MTFWGSMERMHMSPGTERHHTEPNEHETNA